MNRTLRHRLHQAGLQRPNLPVGSLALLCALADRFISVITFQPVWLAGRFGGQSARRPEAMGRSRGFGRTLILLACSVMLFGSTTFADDTPSHGVIPNQVTLTYDIGGPPVIVDSNIASFVIRTPAVIEFLKYAPSTPGAEEVPIHLTRYQDSSLNMVDIPLPEPALQLNVPLVAGSGGNSPIFYLGETFYLRLTDLDQNLDPQVAETVIITVTCTETGDLEVLQLTESAPNTGIFTGYLPAVTNGTPAIDGQIEVVEQGHLQARYKDIHDNQDITVDAALIDPYGFVFDSSTGEVINGATVTLLDDSTGQAALVYGEDGVSIYQPDGSSTGSASVVTGGTATDSSGRLYNLPDGGFRFPYVMPGTYRLLVELPEGYVAPSTISNERLLIVRPGAILKTGSRGEPFVINPGPAIRIDIPVDPLKVSLWLQKSAHRNLVEIGDFLEYRLTVENTNEQTAAPGVTITDTLPSGLRYQGGSTRLEGTSSPDPQISKDGRTLTFDIGDLPPATSRTVTYTVEIAAGSQTGKVVNRAQAIDARGVRSNIAAKTVTIKEPFFRNTVLLAGRVFEGTCDQENDEMIGLPDVRIYLEDGSHITTDHYGRYHFEGIEPGVHVVQVDTLSLPAGYEMLPCEETTQFAGRTFSQFVDLQGGTLWRVDFYAAPKPPPTGEVTLQMTSELEGQIGTFHIDITAQTVLTDNLRLTVMLPGKSIYREGSAQIDHKLTDNPQTMPGVVIFRLGDLQKNSKTRVSFKAKLDTTVDAGTLPARALLLFDTASAENQRLPIVETHFKLEKSVSTRTENITLRPHFPTFIAKLQETDLVMLEELATRLEKQKILQIEVIGHTDSVRIAPRSRHLFADNVFLSLGRAGSVAKFLRDRLKIPAEAMTVRGLGKIMPIADNATKTGRALNRRVELYLVTAMEDQAIQLELSVPQSELESIATTGGSEAAEAALEAMQIEEQNLSLLPPEVDSSWLKNNSSELELIWPAAGYVPEIPSLQIMLKHRRGLKPSLKINGEPVNPLNFNTIKTHPSTETIVSMWEGVDIRLGFNRIEASVKDVHGQEVASISREFWYSMDTFAAELDEGKSTLIADGLQPVRLAVRLTDRDGHPIRPGQQGQFSVAPPHRAQTRQTQEGLDMLDLADNKPRYETGADGIAYLILEPTSQAGMVRVEIPTIDGFQQIETWLVPAPRDWVLVGFAEGTLGYNNLSGNNVSLNEAGIEEHYYDDGQVKFFAKGAVKGEWLLTVAYDSDKPDLDGESLHQIIDPDSFYPLYGDATNQSYEASSAKKIYVRVERNQFYAMFGDMSTDLNQTELASFNRSLTGFKAEETTENYSYKLFAAETSQNFAKDEIRGDGTSGRYQLSGNDLVINSEQIVIETRDRLHSEVIISEVALSRYTDYEIDYDTGSLYFKRPVQSRDEDFNPVFIVVRYEKKGSTDTNYVYGGRGAVTLLGQRIEIGATYVHEDQDQDEGDLFGIDTTVQLTEQIELHAEAAMSDNEYNGANKDGTAYLVEVNHLSRKTRARAYFREQEKDFGLGQLNDSEGGMRKYGAQVGYNVTQAVTISAEAYHEDNLTTDAKRDVFEATADYQTKSYLVRAGARHIEDKLEDGSSQKIDQAILSADWNTRLKGVTLRTNLEQSLSKNNESSDYPTLLTIGADYALSKRIRLFADQRFTWSKDNDTEGTRVGISATPWNGGYIESSVEQQLDENGQRMFALFGLDQTWQVNSKWAVFASLDRSQNLKPAGSNEINPNAPSANGSDEDFTSVSLGSTYNAGRWSWSNRLETRLAENEDKYGATSSIVGEVRQGLAASAKVSGFLTDGDNGNKSSDGIITLGLAYRPNQNKWMFLERFDFEFDNLESHNSDLRSRKLINHLHANYKPDRKLQVSLYSGIKYIHDDINGRTYSGTTDMLAGETRYNISKRWDVGAHGSYLHSWNSNTFEYSTGASIGCMVIDNTWVSLGYNFTGFEDDDFSAANYTAKGAYIRFRMKLDQQSVREAAEWLNR